jgi:hypothetical protein
MEATVTLVQQGHTRSSAKMITTGHVTQKACKLLEHFVMAHVRRQMRRCNKGLERFHMVGVWLPQNVEMSLTISM